MGFGEFVREVDRRRVVDFGGASFTVQPSMGFAPRWQNRAFLRPMNERRFIAPMKKFTHSAAVRPRHHESLHGGVGGPKCSRPEGVTPIAQQFDSEISFRARSLSRGTYRVNGKHGHKPPRTHAQAGDRHEGHALV